MSRPWNNYNNLRSRLTAVNSSNSLYPGTTDDSNSLSLVPSQVARRQVLASLFLQAM